MTEPAEESQQERITCPPAYWYDERCFAWEDSQTRQEMREAREECEERD